MLEVTALSPDGFYRTRKRIVLNDAGGQAAVEASAVASLVLADWVNTMRSATPLSADELCAVLSKAANIFESEVLLGDDLVAHEERVASLTGTPLRVIQACDRLITAKMRDVANPLNLAKPTGAALAPSCPMVGASWSRRGEVFGVIAAGNSPGVHALWLEALALGYRVVVRPSNRDVVTPTRVIAALRAAGLPNELLVLAPCDHASADALVERVDLALVYGSQSVVDKYRNRADVLTQGPGRAKLVVGAGATDRHLGLDLAVEGALYHAGTACTATTGVLVEGDYRKFAVDLSVMLGSTEIAAPWQDNAALPAMHVEQAERLVADVLGQVDSSAVVLAPRVESVGAEGVAVVTPAVFELNDSHDPLLGYEVPFPCVWVAPLDRASSDALGNSLVVSFTSDDVLAQRTLARPDVSNVYVGRPTSWMHPDVPHDGFLGEFLMRCKGFAVPQVDLN